MAFFNLCSILIIVSFNFTGKKKLIVDYSHLDNLFVFFQLPSLNCVWAKESEDCKQVELALRTMGLAGRTGGWYVCGWTAVGLREKLILKLEQTGHFWNEKVDGDGFIL